MVKCKLGLRLRAVVLVPALLGCATPERALWGEDAADYPLRFSGDYLGGAFGDGTLARLPDGRAYLEMWAFEPHPDDDQQVLAGARGAFLARARLLLEATGSQDGQWRFVPVHDPRCVLGPTVESLARYVPISGEVVVSPSGALSAQLHGPREAPPTEENARWVPSPSFLDEHVEGPVAIVERSEPPPTCNVEWSEPPLSAP